MTVSSPYVDWKPIPGYDGYEASSTGLIRRGERLLRIRAASRGGMVTLGRDGTRQSRLVHRLVIAAFGLPLDRQYTWADGDRHNNTLANLIPKRNLTPTCNMCGVLLTEENTTRKDSGGFYNPCTPCRVRRRRDRGVGFATLDTPCEICGARETVTRGGRARRPVRDHNHATGQQRGILCSRCNVGLGALQDSASLLRAAADYLDRYAYLPDTNEGAP